MTSGEREPVVITCASDTHYVKPLAVMLQSVMANLSPDRTAEIYVVDGGVEPRDKKEIARFWPTGRATVHWIPADASAYSGAPLWGRMPVSTYFKLALADGLPRHVHKAIWLDCDLLVTADLTGLWDLDLAGHYLRAVQDSIVPLVSSPFGVAPYRELGIAKDEKYFNAGVMLVNVDKWRDDRIPERVLDYLKRFRRSVFFWDQEGLNAVLAGSWGDLDPRWNINASVPARSRGSGSGSPSCETPGSPQLPWIIHWAGYLKPWRYPGRDAERLLYFRYLDMTAWAGWRPPSTLASRLIGLYESSGLRAGISPAEQWGLRVIRRMSRRVVPAQNTPAPVSAQNTPAPVPAPTPPEPAHVVDAP